MAACIGVVITSMIVRRVRAAGTEMEPEFYWALGLGAITPAWLVAFRSLLEPEAAAGGRLKLFFMAAIGVGLAGLITTDVLVRRLRGAGRNLSPFTLWLLGVAALVPTCLLTLLGWPWLKP